MKLTKEERQTLYKEIFDDMPDNFRLFPPWTSLFLLEVMLLMASGGIASGALLEKFNLHPVFGVVFVVLGTLLVCIPNLFITFGYTDIGIRLVRVSAKIFLVAGIISLTRTESWGSMIFFNAAPFLAAAVLIITYSIRFLAFAEFRKQNMAWVRERKRKNKEFIASIKARRRTKER